MDDLQKFKNLKSTIQELSDKKIRLEERYKNEKEKLEKLLTEISSKGYDPKNLSQIKKEKEDQLQTLLQDLEKKVTETQQALSQIEAS